VIARHPEPPPTLASIRLLIRPIAASWFRLHSVRYDALHFGKDPLNRFDAPAGQFGVLYVGRDPHCAFIETFGHETGRTPFVTEAELRSGELSIVETTRALRLVDLRGEGLARMGADAALIVGPDCALSRRWALALHDHPRAPDGVLYRARHDPARTCAAIFDRAKSVTTAKRSGTLLDPKNAPLLGKILDAYGYGLVPVA
jgi:hypothetical protein